MSIQFEPDSLPKGVRTHVSEAVPFIERNLETVFDHPPSAVRLDLRNRIVLYRNTAEFREGFGPKFLLGIPRLLDRAGSFYAPKWHAVFLWPNTPEQDKQEEITHETLHGYYYQRNPTLREFVMSIDGPKFSSPGEVDRALTERIVVHRFSSEGFAIWGAKEALAREYWDKNRERDRTRRLAYESGGAYAENKLLSSIYLLQEEPNLELAVDQFGIALSSQKPDQAVFEAGHKTANRAYYHLSPVFVGRVMDTLIGRGMSMPEAINTYIANAPTTFAEIKDIPGFIGSLKI